MWALHNLPSASFAFQIGLFIGLYAPQSSTQASAWALMRDELSAQSCSLPFLGAVSLFPAIPTLIPCTSPWSLAGWLSWASCQHSCPGHGCYSHSWISDFQALPWRVAQSPFWLPFGSYLLACILEMLHRNQHTSPHSAFLSSDGIQILYFHPSCAFVHSPSRAYWSLMVIVFLIIVFCTEDVPVLSWCKTTRFNTLN